MTTARQIGTNLGIALVGAIVFSVANRLNLAQHVSDRGLETLRGGMNFVTGVRYGDLFSAALSLASFFIARYSFAPRFRGTHDPETGQFLSEAAKQPI